MSGIPTWRLTLNTVFCIKKKMSQILVIFKSKDWFKKMFSRQNVILTGYKITIPRHASVSQYRFGICPFTHLPFLICFLFWGQFILCNWTYVWNKVGICFSVSRGCCISSQRPMPTWPAPLIKKPLLALVSLSTSPSLHLCGFPERVRACWSEGTCGLDRRHRKKHVFKTAFVVVFIFTLCWS